jgi:hypothetical protein
MCYMRHMDNLLRNWYQSSPGVKPPLRDQAPSSAEVVNELELYLRLLSVPA